MSVCGKTSEGPPLPRNHRAAATADNGQTRCRNETDVWQSSLPLPRGLGREVELGAEELDPLIRQEVVVPAPIVNLL